MRIPERGEKGFTLIELLIVVAILGVLAAVVIPNVGRFIGRGKAESAATELASIQSAVTSMMTDQGIQSLSGNNSHSAVGTATNDMAKFPDNSDDGINLYHYGSSTTISYVVSENTTHSYYVDDTGAVFQVKLPGY